MTEPFEDDYDEPGDDFWGLEEPAGWWDAGAYVCDPACCDDICRNAGACAWPEPLPVVAGFYPDPEPTPPF